MLWAAKQYKWDPNARFAVPGGLATGTFNCNTGLAAYKGSQTSDLECRFNPMSAPTCKLSAKDNCGANDVYNPFSYQAPPNIGVSWGIDKDLYLQGQYWGQS
jgi:hypothetical protein